MQNLLIGLILYNILRTAIVYTPNGYPTKTRRKNIRRVSLA